MIPTNRKKRNVLKSVLSLLERARSLTEDVLDEERDALDNIPENLLCSEKCEAIERAVDNLEDAVDSIEEAVDKIEEASE